MLLLRPDKVLEPVSLMVDFQELVVPVLELELVMVLD